MKKVISIILIILITTFTLNIEAADEKNLTFKSNQKEINKGEKITLTISSNELTAIEGTIKYNTTIWTLESKTSQESFTLNEETGKFALANIAGEEKISVDIVLKSKEDITVNSDTIELLSIIGSNKTGEGYILPDKEVKIDFKATQNGEESTNNQTSTNDKTDTNNQTSNKANQDQQTTKKTTTTATNASNKPETIPYTGVENIFITIAFLGVLSLVFYLGYKKYNY